MLVAITVNQEFIHEKPWKHLSGAREHAMYT
jgi:hypothetical protein